VGQGSRAARWPSGSTGTTQNRAPGRPGDAPPEEKGQLSNPVQRRLGDADADDLVSSHRTGKSIDSLAHRFRVHRTTILRHLDRRGVPRPPDMRKMTDHTIRQAATRYQTGESLTSVAADFGVSARTLAREFKQAGVQIRQRRGWLTAL
jgi:AraC-like DNA-binding protein